MSDNEGQTKKSGYRLEYASSARAKCKGPKPCAGTPIPKGGLRLGSVVDFRGNTSYAWRHWGCTTAKIIANMKEQFPAANDLDGFEDLNEEDQDRVRTAWENGKVADEDIPETARKAEGDAGEEDEEKPKKKRAPPKKKADDGEEKPKRKRAPAKKKAEEDDDDDDDAEEKPKKAPARKPRAKKAAATSDAEAAESDEKPKKKRAPAKKPAAEKKAPAKKRATKKDDTEESGEDFAAAIAEVEDDEAEASEGDSKKRKVGHIIKLSESSPPYKAIF
ncbi:zf-PARP-domain-containing protein [Leucogyrophana mollusca]|uniref:Zf-PARP-domain-containing protein n=1 Tax=Leucogyrophana mollusca TaxID=85980 RepID=A0ACB8AYC1_9AGAM|nr:zf-PARP-domain-containing protein [Leucogyrophana mollusca]